MNASCDPSAIIVGEPTPDCTYFKFVSNPTKKIGEKIPAKMLFPCSPKNHNKAPKNTKINPIAYDPADPEAKSKNGA